MICSFVFCSLFLRFSTLLLRLCIFTYFNMLMMYPWNILWLIFFKKNNYQNNSNTDIISLLAVVDCFISFRLKYSHTSMWSVIFLLKLWYWSNKKNIWYQNFSVLWKSGYSIKVHWHLVGVRISLNWATLLLKGREP